MFNKVKSFHEKFGCVINKRPTIVDNTTRLLRDTLIREESQELFVAMAKEDIIEIADGLADLLYVVFGTAVSYGIPIQEVFDEVHESNMTKNNLKNDNGKVIGKDGNYKPVDLEWLKEL